MPEMCGARDFCLKAGETFPRREGLKSSSFTGQGGEHLTDVLTDHAIDFIHQNTEKPFFLYLPCTAPHDPLQGKPKDLRKLFPETFERMTDADIRATSKQREDKHLRDCHYAALVYGLDHSVGRIMQMLQQAGIARNTIVIFTSDNGAQHGSNYPLTGHKWDGLEGGIRVPCIIWSRSIAESDRAGAVYDGLASVVDIAPNLWAQASAEAAPFPSDGINLLPLLLAEKPQPRQGRYFITNACYTFQSMGKRVPTLFLFTIAYKSGRNIVGSNGNKYCPSNALGSQRHCVGLIPSGVLQRSPSR